MGVPVLLMGESGTGKSTSLRNFGKDEIALVNVLGKPLPFRGKVKQARTRDVEQIRAAVESSPSRTVVIDDFGYAITDIYTRGSYGPEKFRDQYEVYKKIGNEVYNLVTFVQEGCPDDVIVYFVMHSAVENGEVVPATIGKMLNEKINLVGMFTVTILSAIDADGYCFVVNGTPPTKAPPGMFGSERIPNDLKAVDDAIRDFWGLAPLGKDENGEKDA